MTGWKERHESETARWRRVATRDCDKQTTLGIETEKRARARNTLWSRGRDGGGTGAGARQVPEGARGMPWLPEAKKDAAGCEKPRGGANGL